MPAPSLVLVALLGSGQGAAQGLEAKVTYTTPGASAGTVVKDLSAQTGLTLTTSPQTDGDVIVVHLQGVPLKDALPKIAWAVGGSWKKEGESYRLVRTSDEARAEWARERAQEIAAYKDALKQAREGLAKDGEFSGAKAEELAKQAAAAISKFDPTQRNNQEFWQFSTRLSNQAPSGRAMARIMALLTPNDLADLPKGIKVAYSTQPTRAQRPLGPEVGPIIETLRREQNVWIDAVTKYNVKNPTVGNTTYILNGVHEAEPLTEKAAKVLLTVIKSRYGGGVRLELLVGDAKGRIIARANGNVSSQIFPTGKAPEVPKDDPKIVRPPDAEALAKSLMSQMREPLPEELRQRMLRPEEHEPLAMTAGSMHVALAQARKVNLVSALSETYFYTGMYGAKETPVTLFLHGLRSTNEVQEGDGWMTVRPIAAATARQVRVDRRLLGQYLRRKAQGTTMKVAEKAAWAIRLPLEEESPLPRMLSGIVASSNMGDRYGSGDSRILRLFGSLNQAQMATAKQGGLPLNRLSAEQIGILQQMVYGEYVHLQPDYQKAQEAKIDVNLLYNGLMKEPTESLPNGIPPDGVLEITENTEEVAFTEDWEAQGYARPSQGLSAEQLAWQQFSQTRLDLFPYMNEPYQKMNLDRLRLGKRTMYTIAIKFTPILMLNQSLEDRDYTTGEVMAYNRLPAEFRAKVDAAIENYRKAYANMKPGNPGTPATHTSPPPMP